MCTYLLAVLSVPTGVQADGVLRESDAGALVELVCCARWRVGQVCDERRTLMAGRASRDVESACEDPGPVLLGRGQIFEVSSHVKREGRAHLDRRPRGDSGDVVLRSREAHVRGCRKVRINGADQVLT